MAYRTIKVKKYQDIIEEYTANAAIIPGMLVELMSTGKLRKHATEGGNVLPMFALEDELQGNGVDDAYAADDKVQVWVAQPGEVVNAILEDGETVAVGDFLESNGAGFLQKHTAQTLDSAEDQSAATIYTEKIVAVALEYKDLSGSSGEDSAGESSVGSLGFNKRIKVRIV